MSGWGDDRPERSTGSNGSNSLFGGSQGNWWELGPTGEAFGAQNPGAYGWKGPRAMGAIPVGDIRQLWQNKIDDYTMLWGGFQVG